MQLIILICILNIYKVDSCGNPAFERTRFRFLPKNQQILFAIVYATCINGVRIKYEVILLLKCFVKVTNSNFTKLSVWICHNVSRNTAYASNLKDKIQTQIYSFFCENKLSPLSWFELRSLDPEAGDKPMCHPASLKFTFPPFECRIFRYPLYHINSSSSLHWSFDCFLCHFCSTGVYSE